MTTTKAMFRNVQHFLSGRGHDVSSPRSKPPYLLALRSSTIFIVFTICLAVFTDIFFYGLIVPVIPFSLTVQVGVPEDQVQQWTAILLACYNIALFAGSPLVGVYADHTTSRRLPLLLGLLALAGSTLLLCLGKTIALLVVGRLLQGLSAAVVWSSGLALLADTMGKDIGYAMGYIGIAMSIAFLVAPVIGGAVYGAAGYYAVYYVAFWVIFCDVVLRLVLIEKKVARRWITDDEAVPVTESGRAVSGSNMLDSEKAGAAPDMATVDAGREAAGGRGDPEVEATDVISPALSAGVRTQTPDTSPASPAPVREAGKHRHLELIRSRRILAALFGCVVEAGVMFSFDTVLPLFVKDTFHWTSTAAGLIFICVMVPGFGAPVVGMLSDKYGARWPSLAGFVATVPLLVCLRFVTEDSTGQKVLLGAILALLGVTLPFCMTPLMAEISYAIEEKEARRPGMWGEKGVYGIGYGLLNMAVALGGTAGSFLSGYVVAGPGWGTMTWVLAIWSAAGIPVVALWVGGKPFKRLEGEQHESGN